MHTQETYPCSFCLACHGLGEYLKQCRLACHKLRRMTRRAGRLTPAARVEVAVSTSSVPERYPFSMMWRSWLVSPA